MDAKNIVTIDLTRYGADGSIEMCYPSFRQMNAAKNYAFRQMKMSRDTESISDLPGGDMEIMSTVTYVSKAPFEKTLEGFLAFADRLDAVSLGAAEVLYAEMQEAVAEIDKVGSPFGNSQTAMMQSSD